MQYTSCPYTPPLSIFLNFARERSSLGLRELCRFRVLMVRKKNGDGAGVGLAASSVKGFKTRAVVLVRPVEKGTGA
ncbi:UNVERIFIED_CONTAM: hypothetical protein Sradi_4324800 [Sesamum radiatum]|uniref:Uncharacterized protein n=1 Tax=Sesamum radiatum TaxID=300843 RepID=A0AAW2NPV0_SESRA